MNIDLVTEQPTPELTAFCQAHALTLRAHPGDAPLYLEQRADGLTLVSTHPLKTTLRPSFISPAFQKRLKETGKKSLLAKAIGHQPHQRILDATAGLGRDACLMAKLGHSVHMVEQSPILYLLLQQAIQEAQLTHSEIMANLQLTLGDSTELMAATGPYDVIYLDPMFPERQKSALVKKEMQLLQTLLGHENTAQNLLDLARQRATNRVVLKRPKLAPIIDQPDLQFKGKTQRFDVYTQTSRI